MKGKLLKDDIGWFVEYYEEVGISKSLSLWREDVIKVEDYISNYHDDLNLHPQYYEGAEVEFEIRINALSPTWEPCAILIHPEIPRLMYRDGKEIRSYHSPKIDDMLKEIEEEEMSENKNICEYSGLRSVTSYTETKETLYTEEQLKLAYMQGYNRGKDGNPNHMESYIEFLKQQKKD